jgi:Bacteriophage tail sheath protein
VPQEIHDWLEAAGWAGHGPFARSSANVEALLDVPMPIESWGAFDHLFAWDQRLVRAGSPQHIPCPLGLAVRSFFQAGGVRAYVVRTGDPLPLLSDAPADQVIATKRRLVSWANVQPPPDVAARVPLIPGFLNLGDAAQATDPGTWHGVAHVLGVDEAAMLSLPDLPELFAGPPTPMPAIPAAPPVPEQFKPCAPPTADFQPETQVNRLALSAPRLDRAGYGNWARAVQAVLSLLSVPNATAHRRDVMLVASLPLPSFEAGSVPAQAETWPLAVLDEAGIPLDEAGIAVPDGRMSDAAFIGNARLQLAWPWVETVASAALPEGIEGAEGAVLGAIARTSLLAGAFRSAADTVLPDIRRLLPEPSIGALRRGLPDGRADWVGDRLTVIGKRPSGFVLFSDATMSASRTWRAAGVSRLMGIILRAARFLGQDRLFEPSGPALWIAIRHDFESFLERLRQAGAIDGETTDEAYLVRCDRTTMTQNDLDAGRVIVVITFTAAQPVERITVTLALGQSDGLMAREAAKWQFQHLVRKTGRSPSPASPST